MLRAVRRAGGRANAMRERACRAVRPASSIAFSGAPIIFLGLKGALELFFNFRITYFCLSLLAARSSNPRTTFEISK